MSHVEFKKLSCPLLLFSDFHVDFKLGPCRMSILGNNICHVVYGFPHVDRPHVACRF